LKIALIGARCKRQGTGPWFAKHFTTLGASLSGIMGTCIESALQASAELEQRFGIVTTAYSDWESLIKGAQPDLLVIASPAATHRSYLQHAIDSALPVFVEKPFVWEDGRDNVQDTRELVQQFEKKKIPLFVNTQWLESLEEFQVIYPHCDLNHVTTFEMNLSPTSKGVDMIVDALPHAWSMLYELVGEGEIEEIKAVFSGEKSLKISGFYHHEKAMTEFHFTMKTQSQQPRSFSYAINGNLVERIVDLSSYMMSFKAKNGIFPLRDPMEARIRKILTLIEKKSYNDAHRRIIVETELLNQSIKALKL